MKFFAFFDGSTLKPGHISPGTIMTNFTLKYDHFTTLDPISHSILVQDGLIYEIYG